MNYSTTTAIRSLNDNWRVREAPSDEIVPHNQIDWIPAKVPCHIHLDLMDAGVIGDPFVRMYERSVQWVDDADWIYETAFAHEAAPGVAIYLVFKGLDTIATITLNGEVIGSTENMHRKYEFRVDHLLTTGADDDSLNVLQVRFSSAKRLGMQRHDDWNAGPDTVTAHWDTWSHRSMIRKAQYMYGWDWGPVLISCGIWQPVELVSVPVGRLVEWNHSFAMVNGAAEVTFVNQVENLGGSEQDPVSLRITLAGEKVIVPVERMSGEVCSVTATLRIVEPVLWQPNGIDNKSPMLYEVVTELIDGKGNVIDSRKSSIGIRTVELLHDRDSDGNGEGFQFCINNEPIFAKGANWIPNSSFPALTNTAKLSDVRERLVQARDAGFNMLRVWGGGLYETDEFYSICDELGIMVWQDFGYGCAYYPDTGDYALAAQSEAVDAVRRLCNHPALVLWCGNNENHTMYHSDWGNLAPSRYLGSCIYEEILPAVVASESPSIPYWASSPSGGDDPNSEDFGDCHNWDVWHGRGDWIHYTENDSRFCSEFGFASSCGLPAWKTVLIDADRWPRSPVVKWHDKTRKGYDTYLGFTELHFPQIKTLEQLVHYTQVNHAEALKYGVEHYRRRKGRCWGTLFWQFNDCWPVQSWSVVDSLGDPKAAYFAAKRFYAPLLASLVRTESGVEVFLVNDRQYEVSGQLELTLMSFDGTVIVSIVDEVTVASNSVWAGQELLFDGLVFDHRKTLVFTRFRPDDGKGDHPVENIQLLAEPKDVDIDVSHLTVGVEISDEGDAVVTLSTAVFVPYVWLRRSDDRLSESSDNFFHLLPGETKIVLLKNRDQMSAHEFKRTLIVESIK